MEISETNIFKDLDRSPVRAAVNEMAFQIMVREYKKTGKLPNFLEWLQIHKDVWEGKWK